MYEYMRALRARFYRPTECIEELAKTVDDLHKNLSEQLDKSQRVQLLQLVDMEDSLRDEASLLSFICGYKLATGIQQELLPPYDYEEEVAQKANEVLRGEG